MALGMEIRKEVLMKSLYVEAAASAFLAGLLGVNDYRTSKTLGNKGGSLSLNQKIDLLIEIGALDSIVRNKFQAFMEIRNIFMHNIEAKTFETCFSFTNGTDSFLLKTYPQDNKLTKEEQLEAAVEQLGTEVLELSLDIIKKVEEKFTKDAVAKVNKNSKEAILESIEEIKEFLDNYFEKIIASDKPFDKKSLKGFGTIISKAIYGFYHKKMEKKMPLEKKAVDEKK